MKQKTSMRTRLTFVTASIILTFLALFTLLLFVFMDYYSRIIEKIYDIDNDILAPVISILILILIILIAISILASVMGGVFISKHFLNQVANFTKNIRYIRKQGLENRIQISGNDELAELGKEFNTLMDEVENSIVAQNQFVQDASHELKTPLAILKGNFEMLKRWGKDDPKILSEYLQISELEVNRMVLIVSELLQLTKNIEVNVEEVEKIEVGQVIKQTVKEFQVLYPDFEILYKGKNNETIAIKEAHFSQLLIILLDNAVKYSSEPSKKIEITFEDHCLKVKDFGIGIAQTDINKIFERFYRADESRKNDSNSFGLGLSIAKKICELYDIQIKVDSIINEYSEFTLIFKKEK